MLTDTSWEKNAGSQIILDSIFAALAGIWITIAIPEGDHVSAFFKFCEVGASVFSFFLFAISAEGTTNACDEHDVLKFVYYLLWYNVGVVLIGGAIWLFIWRQFSANFVHFARSLFSCLSPLGATYAVELGYAILFTVFLWRWIGDAIWLLFADKSDFRDYLAELTDQASPKPDHHPLMRLIFSRRLS
jgi:hypothetical protein